MRLVQSILINCPVEQVFAFTTDFKLTSKWATTILEVVETSETPVRVGFTFQDTSLVQGQVHTTSYEVIEFELNRYCTFKSTSGFLPRLLQYSFEAVPGGTLFTRHIFSKLEDNPGVTVDGNYAPAAGQLEGELNTLKLNLEQLLTQ